MKMNTRRINKNHKEKTRVPFWVYPYKQGSHSASSLAKALNGRVLRLQNSTFRPYDAARIINWGSSDCPFTRCLNPSSSVNRVTNKLTFFQSVKDKVRLPEFWMKKDEARRFLEKKGRAVLARTILTGHSGAGIVYSESGSLNGTNIPDAHLFVEYVPKDLEFRCHVFRDGPGKGYTVIDVQRKVRDPEREVTDWHVRSHQNGFMYTRHGEDGKSYIKTAPKDVFEQAVKAVEVVNLDFGAVDVIWNNKRGKAYVLEVNTAIGMEGQTITNYTEAIRRYYG